MKSPNGNRASFAGIYIENSGITIAANTPSPTYYSVFVGDIDDKNTTNLLFDKLMHGIYGKNSNFRSRNNIFQNTRRFNSGGPNKTFVGGIGIFGINDNSYSNGNNFITTVDPSSTGLINHFYDCHFGVYVQNIFQLDARFDDYRSTQASPGPNGPLVAGQYGVWILSNKFKNYQIRSNKFQNLNIGVYVAAYPSALNIPTYPSFGTYFDRIFVTNNFFSPAMSTTIAAGTGYVRYGVIAVSNISGFSGANTFYTPGAQLSISTNTMDRVWNGDYVSDFSNKFFTAFTANNLITMVQGPNPPNVQYGIEHLANSADVANTNTVIGTATIFSNSLTAGVYRSMNTSGSTQCNSITSVFAGFQFAGANTGAFWKNNIMNTDKRGLLLTNSAILSVQGSSNSPSDNLWQGSWAGNNGTWTDLSITTTLSPLWIRTTSGFIPPFNFGFSPNQTYLTGTNTIFFGNNNAPFAPCLPTGGGGCNNCNPTMLSSMESIVQDSIQYLGNANETSEINKNLVFSAIVMEPTIAAASTTINSFFNANLSLTRGNYKNIEDEIKQGNFIQASNQIGNFNPATNIEGNYKVFYSILNDYLANGIISSQQNIALKQVADKCPFTDGTVVYDARNLYSVINEIIVIYNDQDCDQQNNGHGHEGRLFNNGANDPNQNAREKIQYSVIPNPARDKITLISNLPQEQVVIRITDFAGKLLFEKAMNLKERSANIQVDLLNGMYFVEISNGVYHENKKLIISK